MVQSSKNLKKKKTGKGKTKLTNQSGLENLKQKSIKYNADML